MCWILLGVIMAWAERVYTQDIPEKQLTATDSPLPEIPEMFRAEPAVLEAGRIIRGRSISRAIPGRVVR
jgi:hypothetical protein